MTTTKLPTDLVTWISFQAEFALTPFVVECLAVDLAARGAFIQIPGQPGKYVSRATAFQALSEFCNRTGCGPTLGSIQKIHKQRRDLQARVDRLAIARRRNLGSKP